MIIGYGIIGILLVICGIAFVYTQGDDLTLDLLLGILSASVVWPFALIILFMEFSHDIVIFRGKRK